MTGGSARRLGAAALAVVCLVVLPATAGADADQKLTITGPTSLSEGETATYTVKLTNGEDDDATVDFNATAGAGTSASDFTVTPGTLTVPEGAAGATFTVQ